jgi:GMP synthase-like glutamine amidotransferase
MRRGLTRRKFLHYLAFVGTAGVAGCAAQATAPRPPTAPVPPMHETVLVERVVEVTRLVERVVEVTRVAPSPTREIALEPPSQGIVWYVDIEHEKVLQDPILASDHRRTRDFRAEVMSLTSWLPCDPIHYLEVSQKLAAARHVRAIAISGNVTDWDQYDFATFQPLFDIIQDGSIPVIALCGGHQLIGLMYHAECGALRRLQPGEADPDPSWAPGYYKEVGYKDVSILQDDPLFAGLPQTPIFYESHYWEVKQLPADFELLASTADCRVQAMKHKRFILYGTQFHPEVTSVEHDDGMTLLTNFFRVAGIRKI